jgi:hypothetical protein
MLASLTGIVVYILFQKWLRTSYLLVEIAFHSCTNVWHISKFVHAKCVRRILHGEYLTQVLSL